mmetsp:Transcript_15658/g.43906  ORF Transcript_15658/g.43906 Transcript_15658/m.43906 type:complete len:385 (+) Transcript_15658:276-1430(+)
MHRLVHLVHAAFHQLHGKGPHQDPFDLLGWNIQPLCDVREFERALAGRSFEDHLHQRKQGHLFLYGLGAICQRRLCCDLRCVRRLDELAEFRYAALGTRLQKCKQPFVRRPPQRKQDRVRHNLAQIVHPFSRQRRQAQIDGKLMLVRCRILRRVIQEGNSLLVKCLRGSDDLVIRHACLVVGGMHDGCFRRVGGPLVEQGRALLHFTVDGRQITLRWRECGGWVQRLSLSQREQRNFGLEEELGWEAGRLVGFGLICFDRFQQGLQHRLGRFHFRNSGTGRLNGLVESPDGNGRCDSRQSQRLELGGDGLHNILVQLNEGVAGPGGLQGRVLVVQKFQKQQRQLVPQLLLAVLRNLFIVRFRQVREFVGHRLAVHDGAAGWVDV